jgi:protein tyrosine phosphatase
MNIVENILIWDSKESLKAKYSNSDSPSIKELSQAISSDEVAENIDANVDNIIANVIRLKETLGDSETVNKYINAVLIETESTNKYINSLYE